ncbi:MAG: glycosyltransferase, partial [Chitinivibrionales bacterium]|nr:glycosyltransferase [Chitinivibrionales bacterium]MBD3394851.1 glycosyltransferase [Chitinivibrionales bacterium]
SAAYRQGIERALDRSCRERVWFLGAVERLRLPALYGRSDIFLIPSLFDNAPNSLFEAMAAKLPVIASDVGGMNEIIRDGENGLLFPVDRHAGLIDSVRRMVEDPRAASRMAEQAYEEVTTLYNPKRIAEETLAFYRGLAAPAETRKPRWPSVWSRRLFRQLPLGARIRLRGRVSLLYQDAGHGDTLLAGAVAREIKRKYGPVHVTVNGAREDLLHGNPFVDQTGRRYDGINLNYHTGHHRINRGFTRNLLDIMCAKVGVRNPEHTVDVFLDESELIYAREVVKELRRPIITIQTTSGDFGAGRKHWPHEYWVELVRMLRSAGCSVMHLGASGETPIPAAIDRLGRQDVRRSIAILKAADMHIGIVSSLMHAAEAVQRPALILFGGFERYSAHRYEYIHPLESTVDCAPCAEPDTNMDTCPFDNRCMREIRPAAVMEKVREIIDGSGRTRLGPLPTEATARA